MWPDDDRLVAFNDDGLEPELASLADALAAAGHQARAAAASASPSFAADLRARLVGPTPAVSTTAPVSSPSSGAATTVIGETATLDRVRPQVVRRASTVVRVPRWSMAAVAAALVIAVVGTNGRWLQGGPADASVVGAVEAALIRDGARIDLVTGQELVEGDRIVTGADGSATLALAGGETRLAAGADMTITDLDRQRIALEQDRGRAWHRVSEHVEQYVVTTADVTWSATGTAFDLDRRAAPGDGEEVRAVGIEHVVAATGPGLAVDIDEGTVAVIALESGDASRDVRLSDATSDDLLDPWLRWNGRRDVALGFDAGILERELASASASASATPTSRTTPAPTGEPTSTAPAPTTESPLPVIEPATADPTTRPAATPTPRPTASPKPTPKPTAKPTATPTATPAPELALLGLTVTACHGGSAVLDWTKASAEGFGHYQGLRSTSASVAPVYPPKAPAVAPDGLYAADRETVRGVDVGLAIGQTYAYRAIAFTPDDVAYAASPVKTIQGKAVKALGALDWSIVEGTVVTEWLAYGGPEACFSVAKLVVSQDDESPSYLDGSSALWASEDQAATTAALEGLASGTHYARLEVLRDTWVGRVVVAHTDVATIVVP